MHCPGLRRCNQELKRIVLEHEQGSPSLGRSDVGDRHSGDDVLEWPYPRIDFLKGFISEGFGEFTNIEMEGRLSQDHDVNMDGGAWVNLCRNGGYNTIHNHPDCSWDRRRLALMDQVHCQSLRLHRSPDWYWCFLVGCITALTRFRVLASVYRYPSMFH